MKTLEAIPVASVVSTLSSADPFPGLRPYEEGDAGWFFGRSAEINELLKRLRRLHFVAIVGASGCGKSSLVRAGLLPQIRDGYLDAEWTIATFRPGEHPIANLAAALSEAVGDDPEHLLATLHTGSMGLVKAMERERRSSGKILIVVDQFEELFQFAQRQGDSAQEEIKEFLKLLLTAASSDDVDVYVMVTMRLEWLNECATYVGLSEAINEGIYLVPQMQRRQFQQAILGPLESAGGSITSALLDRMLNDLDNKTDQLPVLQHALLRIWNRCGATEAFDRKQYELVGTFSNCLSAHAEEIFAELNPRRQKVAELLFRAITQVSKGRKIRRPRQIGEIMASTPIELGELDVVINAYSKAGRSFLITTQGKLTRDSIVDISHEALIRQWVRLSGWVENEAEIQARIGRLQEDAAEWDRDRNNQKACLYTGSRLLRAEELRPSLAPASTAADFLKAGSQARFWLLVWQRGGIVLGILILLGGATLVAILSRQRAVTAQALASLAVERQNQAQKEADDASLQAQKSKAFQDKIVHDVEAAKGSATALAAISRDIQAQRVYLQYVSGDQARIKTIQAQLQSRGYAVPGYELVSPDHFPSQTQVRFFHPEDKDDAAKLAGILKPLIATNVATVAIPNTKNIVPPGQFEVWLVPSASAPPLPVPSNPSPGLSPAQVAASTKPIESSPAPAAPVAAPAATLVATASRERIEPGQSVTLRWMSDAPDVELEGVGTIGARGSRDVIPRQSTTYRFTTKGSADPVTASVNVEVLAPVAPPPVASAGPEPQAVKAALNRYKEAYESESLDDLKLAWPTMSKAQQKNTKFVFDQFNAIRLTLNCQDIHVSGDQASATCQQVAVYTQKGKRQPEQTTSTTFGLKKQGDFWVVDSVQ